MENKSRRHIHIFWPLLLIAVGVFLFLNNLGFLPGTSTEVFLKLWPILLILGGVEGFINREGFLWPVLITGLGVLFLLSNFGLLSVPVWTSLIRLWPILLIALGLNLIVGHAKGWIAPVLGVVIGLLLVGCVYLLSINRTFLGNPHSEQISIPAEGVTEATGSIVMPVGKLQLSAGNDEDLLVAGTAALSRGESMNDSFTDPDDPGDFTINSSGANYVFSLDSGTYSWNLEMNKEIPFTDLDVEVYTGEISADFSALRMAGFNLRMPVGKLTLALPRDYGFTGTADVSVGEIILCVPSTQDINIHLDPAVTIVNLDKEFKRESNLVTWAIEPAASPFQSDLYVKLPVGIIFIHDLENCDLAK